MPLGSPRWVLQGLTFPLVSSQDQATLQRKHEKRLNGPKQEELELTLNWARVLLVESWNRTTTGREARTPAFLHQPVHGERIYHANPAGIAVVSSTHEHRRRGFLGSTEVVFQNPCSGAHSFALSLLTAFWKQSVHVLSCVRLTAPVFQHELFFFHCLGATLAEQMNQTMLLNQSRANTISKYYPIAWFWADSLSAWPYTKLLWDTGQYLLDQGESVYNGLVYSCLLPSLD